MTDEAGRQDPGRRSSSAEAAATRWRQQHPEEEVDLSAPAAPPEDEDIVPNRHSASAEAAALRWHERHPDDKG